MSCVFGYLLKKVGCGIQVVRVRMSLRLLYVSKLMLWYRALQPVIAARF